MYAFLFSVYAACDPVVGCISPTSNHPIYTQPPEIALGSLFTVIIRLVIVVASLLTLAYLLWGALDWITSGGDKEKIIRARDKITYALIGIIFIILSFSIFGVVAGNILGIVQPTGSGFIFSLPKVGGP